jgi:guanylate kinase
VTSVSHTTRAPRPGERDGLDYHFVAHDVFAAMVAAGAFVEHARFGSNRYGTSRATIADVAARRRTVLLDIEMEVRAVLPRCPAVPLSPLTSRA